MLIDVKRLPIICMLITFSFIKPVSQKAVASNGTQILKAPSASELLVVLNQKLSDINEIKRRLDLLEVSVNGLEKNHELCLFRIKNHETDIRALDLAKKELKILLTNQVNAITDCKQKMTSKSKLFRKHFFTYVWKIDGFTNHQLAAADGSKQVIYSNPFYSNEFGYKMRILLYPNGDQEKSIYVSCYLQIMRGSLDEILKWPIEYRAVISIINQLGHDYKHHRKSIKSLRNNKLFGKPTLVSNKAWGISKFIPVVELTTPYVINDTMYIELDMTIM